jgi:hypothetical protein
MIFIWDIPTSYIECVLHYFCWVKGNEEPALTVSSIYNINFNFFFPSLDDFRLWLKWCIFGHTSHYNNIKLKSMASVYTVFPCHACECASLLSSDSLFLHFSWNSRVMLFCIFSWRIYWHPVSIICGCITFNMLWRQKVVHVWLIKSSINLHMDPQQSLMLSTWYHKLFVCDFISKFKILHCRE